MSYLLLVIVAAWGLIKALNTKTVLLYVEKEGIEVDQEKLLRCEEEVINKVFKFWKK